MAAGRQHRRPAHRRLRHHRRATHRLRRHRRRHRLHHHRSGVAHHRSIPLFRAARTDTVDSVLPPRLDRRAAAARHVDHRSTSPRSAAIGVGVEIDIPTQPDDAPPVFGLTITDLQLPGATAPTDVHVSASGVRRPRRRRARPRPLPRQGAGRRRRRGPIAAIAGLLGLTGDDSPTSRSSSSPPKASAPSPPGCATSSTTRQPAGVARPPRRPASTATGSATPSSSTSGRPRSASA